MCASWPHACMAWGTVDAKSTPLSSCTGSASMSARRATAGLPLPMVATMPVLATGYLQGCVNGYVCECECMHLGGWGGRMWQ